MADMGSSCCDRTLYYCHALGRKMYINKIRTRQGQSSLEYAAIVAVVVAALSAMSLYVQRSVQASLKMIEEQINSQPAESATGGPVGPVTPANKPHLMKCYYLTGQVDSQGNHGIVGYQFEPYDPERVNKVIDGVQCE